LLFSAYFLTAGIGLSLDAVSGFAALVWPPTGIALAALILFGRCIWPAITLAAFMINFLSGAPFLVAVGIAIGNTLEPFLGAYILERYLHFDNRLRNVKDVLGLVVFAALLCTLIGATIGVTSLFLGSVIESAEYSETWVAWWVGDMLGALVVAPLILIWSKRPRKRSRKELIESGIVAALLVGFTILIFQGFWWEGAETFPFTYALYPFLIFISLRFGQRGSVSAIFLVLAIALLGTVEGFGPFAGNYLSDSLLQLQSYMGVTAVTFMIMAAAVSEREHTLKRQNELMQRTKMLTKQRENLVVINQAKDEFISLASHQLRTPATAVKQYIGMLMDSYAGELTKSQHTMMLAAYESNEREIQIINDLLKVAQVDAGSVVIKKEKTDLAELIESVLKIQKPIFESRQQTVQFSRIGGNFSLKADKTQLKIVLENLIDNASKYSMPGKKIKILIQKHNNDITISVQDEGVGIAKKDQQKLYKKFTRIDNPLSDKVGGSGLGLYWSKKMIDLHGGKMTLVSKKNQGSVFTVTLPIRKLNSRRN
jgi:signal transduction histidine kinase